MSKDLPTGLGRLFAHFQDLFDTAIKTALKKAGGSRKPGKRKKFLSFFSEMGDSYYKTYEKTKKDADD